MDFASLLHLLEQIMANPFVAIAFVVGAMNISDDISKMYIAHQERLREEAEARIAEAEIAVTNAQTARLQAKNRREELKVVRLQMKNQHRIDGPRD